MERDKKKKFAIREKYVTILKKYGLAFEVNLFFVCVFSFCFSSLIQGKNNQNISKQTF